MEGNPNYLQVESAPSNRSQCRKCKAKIDKGAIRIALCFDDGHRKSQPWNHLECFFLPKKYLEDDVQVGDIRGYTDLTEQHQLELEDRILKLKSGEIKKHKSGTKNPQDIQAEDPKKYKPGGYTEQERKEFEDYKKEYVGFTVAELKAMLAYNEQPQNGTKDEILERVADGWMLGSIPKCPECGEGKMKFNRYDVAPFDIQGTYKCQGYFNADAEAYHRCGRKYKRDEIERDEFA